MLGPVVRRSRRGGGGGGGGGVGRSVGRPPFPRRSRYHQRLLTGVPGRRQHRRCGVPGGATAASPPPRPRAARGRGGGERPPVPPTTTTGDGGGAGPRRVPTRPRRQTGAAGLGTAACWALTTLTGKPEIRIIPPKKRAQKAERPHRHPLTSVSPPVAGLSSPPRARRYRRARAAPGSKPGVCGFGYGLGRAGRASSSPRVENRLIHPCGFFISLPFICFFVPRRRYPPPPLSVL